MSITAEQAVRLVGITQRKADELFRELIAELESQGIGVTDVETLSEIGGSDTTAPVAVSGSTDSVWSLGDIVLSGDWNETARQQGMTYRWGDGSIDSFSEIVTYQGTGDYAGMRLGLGFGSKPESNVVGFFVGGGGGSLRALTVFFPADDFATSNQKVSMIKGGGPRGRSGFAPGEVLPKAYQALDTEILRDRVAGKWNVTAVVADADDHKTMLAHTALQARLRGLA